MPSALPRLAFRAPREPQRHVHLLGAVDIVTAILLVTGVALPYAGLVTIGLFAGTLTIFVIAPGVTGFPFLTLVGQFLLKDLGLMAAALNVIAMSSAAQPVRAATKRAVPVEAA